MGIDGSFRVGYFEILHEAVKILKFGTPKKFAVITLKVEQDDFS